MSQFRPQIFLSCDKRNVPYEDERKWKNGHLFKSFATYAELKKNLKTYLTIAHEYVLVTRSRRGEWGEWFERWELIKGKPTIVKQGWN